MTFIVIAIIFIVSFHFIYDGIILPSIRLHFRNQLFSLRDQLRKLKINDQVTKEDERSFIIVENSINISIERLHAFNWLNLRRAIKVKGVHEKSLNRLKIVSNSKNEEILNIFLKTTEITYHVFVASMGGWVIYILPIVWSVYYLNKMRKFIKELLLLPSSVFSSAIK